MIFNIFNKRLLKKELCLLLLSKSLLATGTIANETEFVGVLSNMSMMGQTDFDLINDITLTMAMYPVSRSVTINDGTNSIDFGPGMRTFIGGGMPGGFSLVFNNELKGTGQVIAATGGPTAITFISGHSNNALTSPFTIAGPGTTLQVNATNGLGTSGTINLGDNPVGLKVNNGSSIPNPITSFTNVGIQGSPGAVLSGVISTGGILALSNYLKITGSNTFNAVNILNDSTIEVGNNAALGTSLVTISNANVTLAFDNGINFANNITVSNPTNLFNVGTGNSATLSGTIGGASKFRKNGAGTLIFANNTHNYSGGTDVIAGTLQLAPGATLPTTGTVNLTTAGAILDINDNPQTIGNLVGVASTTVDLGSAILTLGDGNPTSFAGLITGTGKIIKQGAGTLTLSGMNSYSGGTDITAGVIQLGASDSIPSAAILNLTTGTTSTFNLSGFQQTLNKLVGTANSTINLANGQLTVGDTTNSTFDGAITGSGSLIKQGSGALILSGGGLSDYTAETQVNGGTFQAGAINAFSPASPFTIANGGTVDLNSFSQTIIGLTGVNGSMVKSDGGTLTVDNPLDCHFAGVFTDALTLVKENSGILFIEGNSPVMTNITINGGTLAVDGALGLAGSTITIGTNGTLQGHGTVTANVNASGTTTPGGSIGTTTIIGNYHFLTGANFIAEINPIMQDLLDVTGTVTIDPGTTFTLAPEPGVYPSGQRFTVINGLGGVTGTFTNFINPLPALEFELVYTATTVDLLIAAVGLTLVATEGNPQSVAFALDTIADMGASDLDPVIANLFGLSSSSLINALDQLHPAKYKALTIAQQNNMHYMQNALSQRFQNRLDFCNFIDPTACSNKRNTFYLWADGFGGFMKQGDTTFAKSKQVGYENSSGGGVAGCDINIDDLFYMGVLGGYTHSQLDWKHHKGKGSVNSGYGGVYFSAIGKRLYVNTSLIGATNGYHATRRIVYPNVNQTAKTNHDGVQGFAHLDTGLNTHFNNYTLRVFESIDFTSQKEGDFLEENGGVYNLYVSESKAKLLKNELGVNGTRRWFGRSNEVALDLKLSWILEKRFSGKNYKSQFVNTNVYFTTTGYYPTRSLISPALTLTSKMLNNHLLWSVYYIGAFGTKYYDNNVGAQVGYAF